MNKSLQVITLFSITLLSLAFVNQRFVNGTLDLDNLNNYENQAVPNYIQKDNTPGNNQISDASATLGRVLFYDLNLSVNNTIACASCHLQEFAFSDTAIQSVGRNGGLTGRHSMRLANARFGTESRFFWDERANSVEDQATQPIQDHVEMGFSGDMGNPGFDSLINKLESLDYYQSLFEFVYGDANITEQRMQRSLAQFIRSIQSFDSKYDIGRAQVGNNNANFPNFTAQENLGKNLFMIPPGGPNGGAGCNGCHRAPEFDIDPNSRNNGVIGVAGDPNAIDLTNTRSPSLRNLLNANGELNGPMMHNGVFDNLLAVINHYNDIPVHPNNNNLDQRLRGQNGQGQNLNLNQNEKDALIAFLNTLTGTAVYTDERWSDPFDENGNLEIITDCETEVSITISDTICDGENIAGYTATGTYIDTFPNVAEGCDSIRTLNLVVLNNDHADCNITSNGISEEISINIFPNPFTNYIYFDCNNCSEKLVYKLVDISGRLVRSGVTNVGKTTIESGDLSSGVYTFLLEDKSGNLIKNMTLVK